MKATATDAGTEQAADESLVQRAIATAFRAVLRAALPGTFRAGLPVELQRQRLLRITRLTLPPREASFAPASCGGIAGEWVTVRGHERARPVVLYLHGGGYCTGSPATHHALTGHLARRSGRRIFAADYRLAPEHPFPAALEDAVAAYQGLLADGVASRDIVVAGDSAGGGLAVATALRLHELGLPLPQGLVLFSPWVDLTLRQLPPVPPGEVMLNLPWLRECASWYARGTDPRHPLLSPVFADLGGLPPTLVQVGGDEVLLGDAQRLYQRARDAGVPVQLEIYPRRWHVFQANAGVLADADRALDRVTSFLAAAH